MEGRVVRIPLYPPKPLKSQNSVVLRKFTLSSVADNDAKVKEIRKEERNKYIYNSAETNAIIDILKLIKAKDLSQANHKHSKYYKELSRFPKWDTIRDKEEFHWDICFNTGKWWC